LEGVNRLSYDRLLRIIITTGQKARETRGDCKETSRSVRLKQVKWLNYMLVGWWQWWWWW